MRTASVATVGALLLAAFVGCSAQKPDYLYVDMQAQPVRLQLLKSFGRYDQRYAPVAISECAVYEASTPGDSDHQPYPEEIWRVVNVAPDFAVVELRYGVVPRGFLQSYPSGKPPPPLLPGHQYVAECSGDIEGSNQFAIPEGPTPPR